MPLRDNNRFLNGRRVASEASLCGSGTEFGELNKNGSESQWGYRTSSCLVSRGHVDSIHFLELNAVARCVRWGHAGESLHYRFCSRNKTLELASSRVALSVPQGAIEIVDPGDGYATSVPLFVGIQAPGECGGRPGG